MHLLALGAFWHDERTEEEKLTSAVLMHLLALGAFWLDAGDSLEALVGES